MIEENKSKTAIIEMLVKSQIKSPNDQKSTHRCQISKKKTLKNKSTITVNEETNRNSTKPIANQWYQPRQDNNINHYTS